MTQGSLTRGLKQALVQALREDPELLAEVIEDVAMANAIREGEGSRPVKRETIMKALRGRG